MPEVPNQSRPDPPRPAPDTLGRAWTDRLRDASADPRARVALLLVAALVAGLVWYRLGSTSGGGDEALPPPARELTDITTTTTRATVVVHVAGAVARPGIVEIAPGARVADALRAAGGGLADADLDRLNLAAKVVDGQRIAVARVGELPPPLATGSGDPSSPAVGSGPLNLNTATSAELEALPGIGPALAAAIITERERRGGFTAVEQLQDVRGIGEGRFADLRDLVTV